MLETIELLSGYDPLFLCPVCGQVHRASKQC